MSVIVVLPARQQTGLWRPSQWRYNHFPTRQLVGRGYSGLETQIISKMSGAEGKGKPLHYFPKKVVMKRKPKIKRWPCDPLSNRRRTASGADGVKLVTGHENVGDQASHGNWTTGIPLKMRHIQKIGTWNVRGLLKPGKLHIVEKEISRCELNICGLSETHWRGNGHFLTESHVIYFSGNDENSNNGVAFVLPTRIKNCVLGYEPISDRIMTIRIKATPVNLNIIQVYAPTSNSSDKVLEDFYRELEKAITKTSKREVLIVLGDFNAKIGNDAYLMSHCAGKFGLGQRNDRGDRLIQFATDNDLIISNSFFQHHPRRLWTWITPDGKHKNQIDYILIGSRWKSSIKNTHTLPGADCGSDHQLLMSKVQLKLRAARRLEKQTRIEVKDGSKFRSALEQNWVQWTSVDLEVETPDQLWERSKRLIEDAAQKSKPPAETRKRQHWISDETVALVEERRRVKSQGADVRTLNKLSAEIQTACRRDQNAQLQNICAEVEAHADKHEDRDLHRKIRSITKTLSSRTWAIENSQGETMTEIDAISETWKEYCQSLFEDPQSQCFASTEPANEELEPDILKTEVRAAIKHLKNGKAVGRDSIPIETIKASGEYGVQIFQKLCNKIWRTSTWPHDWAHSVFVPLHKKGSTRSCSNYRLIALISHASKILLHILNERLKSYLSKEIAPEQAGFVKGKGTREQILTVRQIIEKAREFNKPTYICFVDFSKAFDSVQWPKLWNTLLEMGTPKHLVHLIRNLYEKGTASVRTDEVLSGQFHPSAGVRQGCIVSPLLFNIYTELIMRITLDEWTDGISIGGLKISNLRYADDTTLFATSIDHMQELLKRMEAVSLEFGLKINRSKTKVMIVDRANDNSPEVKHIANCEVVQSYVYLGALISKNGGCIDEVKRRMAITRSTMSKLQKVWKNRNITKATKTRLVRSLIFPVFLYAAETWTLREIEKRRIDALEMWCWRRMLGISWTEFRTNESILKELGIKQRLSSVVQARILTFFGHVSRRGNVSVERLVVQGKIEGTRPRGRSPMRWTDQIKAAAQEGSVTECARKAAIREEWRRIVKRATNPD
ncbi:hypothetical protein ABMA27_003004 [Loxostege sticticalis]|uniref:Reverse transcriptase domain-containing protein n=1 Tax=Loxostege sticticalis TaxID=481309 RepID=A0ABR3HRQ3_LOXSC